MTCCGSTPVAELLSLLRPGRLHARLTATPGRNDLIFEVWRNSADNRPIRDGLSSPMPTPDHAGNAAGCPGLVPARRSHAGKATAALLTQGHSPGHMPGVMQFVVDRCALSAAGTRSNRDLCRGRHDARSPVACTCWPRRANNALRSARASTAPPRAFSSLRADALEHARRPPPAHPGPRNGRYGPRPSERRRDCWIYRRRSSPCGHGAPRIDDPQAAAGLLALLPSSPGKTRS